MDIAIEAIAADDLANYARVPALFHVHSMLAVEEVKQGPGGLVMREMPVEDAYIKDYDAYGDGGPLQWSERFDLSHWGLWVAHQGGDVVGGAAVAWNTPSIEMLEDRIDLAVLWDIRVRANLRRRGVGTALFRRATEWARSKGCTMLKIETQNVNVAACKFYAAKGCYLGQIDRQAYRGCAGITDEVMLIWYLALSRGNV